jgi:hypothetical protein
MLAVTARLSTLRPWLEVLERKSLTEAALSIGMQKACRGVPFRCGLFR